MSNQQFPPPGESPYPPQAPPPGRPVNNNTRLLIGLFAAMAGLIIVGMMSCIGVWFLFREDFHRGLGTGDYSYYSDDGLVGDPAPTTVLNLTSGETRDLASHLGREIVILTFWEGYDEDCHVQLPLIAAVAKEFADKGVVFYTVHLSEDFDRDYLLAKQNLTDIPVMQDADWVIGDLYSTWVTPTTFVIDKYGIIAAEYSYDTIAVDTTLRSKLNELLIAGPDPFAENPFGTPPAAAGTTE